MSLFYKRKNVWETCNDSGEDDIFKFANLYMKFLDVSKTEREFTSNAKRLADEKGFISYNDVINNNLELKAGTKVYQVVKDKAIILAIIGKEPLTNGLNIVGSHIDSPRLDLKQNPLYEDTGLGMLETHYYGGIKKYQWTTIPLSLHGVVVKINGEKVNICIGESEDDPIFTITDLLPHLAQDQMQKKLLDGITGEGLNILCGSMPSRDEEDKKEKVKANILRLLNKRYDIKEEDFISAEIEAVPQSKARSVGFDCALVGAYGQDDRGCAYPALRAILETENPDKTCICILTDKEEIGSVGNTGADSQFFETFVQFLFKYSKCEYDGFNVRYGLANSKMLSADVNPAVDPNYNDVQDKKNASYLGCGVVLQKYTGSRGKVGGSDANAEYLGKVRQLFDNNNVIWHSAELGKVDQGGGGTIAYMMAKYGMEVLDCGVPVLSMHSPLEITSKADIYEMYKAAKVFFEKMK